FFGINARKLLDDGPLPFTSDALSTYARRCPSVATMVIPSAPKSSNAPFKVKRDSSIEIAKDVREIMDARRATGISEIGSGMGGSSGKLSRDIPAILVRDLPHVMLAQWFSRNFRFRSPSGSRRV